MLRLFDPDRDGPALHAVFGDEACCTYLAGPAAKSVEETVSQLKKWNEGTQETTWAIVEREDGEAMGRATLIPRERNVWEIGIMLCPAAQGRGLATKALADIIDRGFDKLGARRIFADIDEENVPSIRLFERLGFTREGLLRANWKTHIGVRHSVIMGLVETDARLWK
ncbi:GNAT family N-acetyltransferase [Hyphococcus luteus]|uniref:N-acetyltransferase n=1 Tax=Hyphococcus luteus TaxID=2058213 RepID=A0A2S7K7E3_9PROT|nr:GNAT family N-acetyltransferase [Marinicaulis flavus]PQA88401.1 N-acetyltransferase [Marinicaulis flavus]